MLRLAITDTEFLSLCIGQLEPDILPSRITAKVFGLCLDYYIHHKAAPGDHFHDELVHALNGYPDDEKQQYIIYVERLQHLDQPNKEYIVRRLNDYIKYRKREQAAEQFAELVYDGKIDEADGLMYSVLKSGLQQEDIGLDYLNDFSDISSRGKSSDILMPTGISAMDAIIGGYRRGWLLTLVGGYKGMKSWALLYLAYTALLKGLKVVLLTHELTREQEELRLDMMLTAMGTLNIGKWVQYPIYIDGGLERQRVKIRPVFSHQELVRQKRRFLGTFGGQLIIKKYPMGQCSYLETDRYLNYLETFENFVPDVLIQDYVDIMQLGSKETRHNLNDIYIQHKGLADERNILVATASQVNSEGLQKQRISMKHIAEDRRKLGNVDLALAICRTEKDEKTNMGRLLVLAGREAPMGRYCNFSCCPDIGQFCISSWFDNDIEDNVYELMGEMGDD